MKTKEEIRAELLSKPMTQIIDIATNAIFENQTHSRMVITQEDFEAHFRLKGITAEGYVETRGRKPKSVEK